MRSGEDRREEERRGEARRGEERRNEVEDGPNLQKYREDKRN